MDFLYPEHPLIQTFHIRYFVNLKIFESNLIMIQVTHTREKHQINNKHLQSEASGLDVLGIALRSVGRAITST